MSEFSSWEDGGGAPIFCSAGWPGDWWIPGACCMPGAITTYKKYKNWHF